MQPKRLIQKIKINEMEVPSGTVVLEYYSDDPQMTGICISEDSPNCLVQIPGIIYPVLLDKMILEEPEDYKPLRSRYCIRLIQLLDELDFLKNAEGVFLQEKTNLVKELKLTAHDILVFQLEMCCCFHYENPKKFHKVLGKPLKSISQFIDHLIAHNAIPLTDLEE